MITEEVARKMMRNLVKLRDKFQLTKLEKDRIEYFNYEAKCVEVLSYFVEMKTNRYRKFANHSDLSQDAYESLLKGIRTFKLSDDEGKDSGSFFYWIGLFVNTKISRSANNHTTIRFPMHVAKVISPHKESSIPIIIDSSFSPEREYERTEINDKVKNALSFLSEEQKEFVNLAYGFDGDGPLSVTKICEKKNIARSVCTKIIDSALSIVKNNLEL